MKNKDPALWTALKLHRILAPQRMTGVDHVVRKLEELLAEQADLESTWRLWSRARNRSWSGAAARLQERLLQQATRVQNACSAVAAIADPTPSSGLPELIADLRQLADEFDEVQFEPRHKRICVVTEPITLEGVALGPFSIQLMLEVMARRPDSGAFEVIAREPHPAGGSEDVTHPHVKGNTLCAGEATAPIAQALAAGRIADAFCLVNGVLHTYNAHSPYTDLQDWDGIPCPDCSRPMRAEERYYCEQCGSDYCERCISTCDVCEESVCLSCLTADGQDRQLCPQCLRTCRRCGREQQAARLLRDRVCSACLAKEEDDAEEVGGESSNQPLTEEQNER